MAPRRCPALPHRRTGIQARGPGLAHAGVGDLAGVSSSRINSARWRSCCFPAGHAVASSASISAASATAASSAGQAAVYLFDQVLDSDMPPELAAIGVMVLVDAKMRTEPIEHLNDLGCLPFGK